MEFFDLVKRRRSIRKYQDRQIERGDLEKIIQAGLCAPNAGGGQRAIIVAVRNRALCAKIGRLNIAKFNRNSLAGSYVSSEQPSIIDDLSIRSGFYGAPHGLRGFRAEEFSVQRCGRLLLCRKHGSGRHGTGACLLSDRTRRRNLRQRTGGRAFEGMADPGRICCTLLRAFGVPCGSLSAGQAPKGRPQPGRRMRWAYGCTDLFEEKLQCVGVLNFSTVGLDGTPQARCISAIHYTSDALYFFTARGKEFCRELLHDGQVADTGVYPV